MFTPAAFNMVRGNAYTIHTHRANETEEINMCIHKKCTCLHHMHFSRTEFLFFFMNMFHFAVVCFDFVCK